MLDNPGRVGKRSSQSSRITHFAKVVGNDPSVGARCGVATYAWRKASER